MEGIGKTWTFHNFRSVTLVFLFWECKVLFMETTAVIGWLLFLILQSQQDNHFWMPFATLYYIWKLVIIKTGLESAFDGLDPRFSLLCQVGDDVIRPCKICRGCQMHVPRSFHSWQWTMVVPYNLDFNLYKECILSMFNAINVIILIIHKKVFAVPSHLKRVTVPGFKFKLVNCLT